MNDLAGKVAIVTGASKGIGAAIAGQFAAAGAAVAVNYGADRAAAERVVAAITAKRGRAIAVQGDVSNAGDVKRLFADAKAAFGRLDVLVNNAGVYAAEAIDAMSEPRFHRQFDVNVLGTLLTIRESLDHFGPEGGSIINLSSIVGKNPLPGFSVYSATKAAVDAITVALARELGARKVRVNAIAPGLTVSEGTIAAGVIGSDFEKQALASTPLGRVGQPDDIGRIAVFLASDQSAWMTGECLAVSGGMR